jgi:RNA polymerase sigma-70 factor (ECF subfamily)
MANSMTPDSAKPLPWPLASAEGAGPSPVAQQLSTRQLFEAHAGFVMRTVRRLGVHPSDTEDVTQEVFMIVHRRIADLPAEVNPRSWLFGIARRVVANYLRKSRRLRAGATTNDVDVVVSVASGDPAQALQQTRERALLERALGRLDADKRAVFVLFELEGLSMQEVAEMVACPLHTAYSRLYAARALVERHVRVSTHGSLR